MIDIGPDEQTICDGETINILLLTPDAGISCGRMAVRDFAHEISSPGFYSVIVSTNAD
ncbi:MAG: hypothetical protein IPP25_12900 [Saprospiraceae bacterium]|nr:hypothetical protein [Candidatus Opimibacter skivensis]